MDDNIYANREDLLDVLTSITSHEDMSLLLKDLFTPREIRECSSRLHVTLLLDRGNPYNSIEEETGASAATIARVSRCLNEGGGGYALALKILSDKYF